ncbi:hypothetical protein R1flu_017096 [Riccia fluitans]|uniref:DUF1995 domain-containing protein n=1 Tax=Riccia fluitans TaxID=41844 RepID=A0ABD1YPJ1_9MARC
MALTSSASALHHYQLGGCRKARSSTGKHLPCSRCDCSPPLGAAPVGLQLRPSSRSLTAVVVSSRGLGRGSNSRRRHMVRAEISKDEPVKKKEYYLPSTLEESIDQARTASRQAIKDGVKRLQLEVPLPLIGATDLDDWPGGIQQQFKAAGPVVTSLLNGLVDSDSYKQASDYRSSIIDEGDAVGAWENDGAALVLFPTADSLEKVEALCKQDRPLLLVNSQWQSGQVISDFGFGSRRKNREDFVNTFQIVYCLKQLRILGEDVRLLKRYPGEWQVFVVDASGNGECIAVEPERPPYKMLESLLKSRKGSKAGQGWLARLFSELEFNQKSLKE